MKHDDLESEFIADFYNPRYDPEKSNYQNCGWGSLASQNTRFQQLFRNVKFEGRKILDFGCGTGDLVAFLVKQNSDFSYLGVDVSTRLLDQAQDQYRDNSQVQFCLGDLNSCEEKIVKFAPNISVASGVFTLKRPLNDNREFAENLMDQMFEITSDMVAANFMSTEVDYTNLKNFHFEPETVSEFGHGLSDQVAIYQNYGLWEFTIQIHK